MSIDSAYPPSRVMYLPQVNWTKQLMDEVAAKLGLERLDHMPGKMWERGVFPIKKVTLNLNNELNENDAIVTFHDDQDEYETIPRTIKYTIRMKKFDVTYETGEVIGINNHAYDGEYSVNEPLVRLQWAIDTSFLYMLTGSDIKQTLMLEQFPNSDEKEADNELALIKYACVKIFSFMTCLAPIVNFSFLFVRISEEKTSGIQELMKMVGVSVDMICMSHFIVTLPGCLLYAVGGTFLLLWSLEKPILETTNWSLIFYALILHFISVMLVAFALAYLVNTKQHLTVIPFLFYIFYLIATKVINNNVITKYVKGTSAIYITGLMTHVPMEWFFGNVGIFEYHGEKLDFKKRPLISVSYGSVLEAYAFMHVQILLFTCLTWYLTRVRPGKYGQPLNWNFPCQKSYWSGNPEVEVSTPKEEVESSRDPRYFEDPPQGLPIGIQILDVTKGFPNFVALSHVSLDLYKGQITVLLGHNGAGKTTLMNIIIGLMAPSSGKVLVNGMDTRSQRKEIRSLLGICPQHNLFFAYLTVREHVRFFAMLKGKSCAEALDSSTNLIEKVNLLDKVNQRANNLSGGMKRRLQLACALAGEASVLMLDEPTSGLDVETRREMWDLLLTLREGRTVLLTTHFMEEADALGDRIAALNKGIIKCDATSMFLKRAVGTGYRLSFTTAGLPNEAAITSAIQEVIPETTIRDKSLNSISYTLPAKDSSQFPALFTLLEEKRAQLGINTIGVGKSTLDEVFMTLCSDTTPSAAVEQTAAATPEPTFVKRSGAALCLKQFLMLLKRQYYYIKSSYISFLAVHIFLPLLLIFAITKMVSKSGDDSPPPSSDTTTTLNLDLYDHIPERRVLLDVDVRSAQAALQNRYEGVEFKVASNFSDEIMLRTSEGDQKYLMGIELNATNAKVFYTPKLRHSASVGVNLLSNVLAGRQTGGASAASIRAITALNEGTDAVKINFPKELSFTRQLTFTICLVVQVLSIGNAQLPSRERVSSIRHIHFMCGCPIPLHWAATFTAHFLKALAFLMVPFIIAQLLLEKDKTTDQSDFLIAASVVLTVGFTAFSAQIYLISTWFSEGTTSSMMVIMMIVTGIVTPSTQLIFEYVKKKKDFFVTLIKIFYYIFPAHTMVLGMDRCGAVARLNAFCNINKSKCEVLRYIFVAEFPRFDGTKCCDNKPEKYMSFEESAPGKELAVMACQFVVYTVSLFMAEYSIFQKMYDRLMNSNLLSPPPRFKDPAVEEEKVRVDKAIEKPKNQITEAVLYHRVRKRFPAICARRRFYALKGISFGVNKGECFGLLGVNGAGKTTSFRILNGQVVPSRGNVFSNGYFIAERFKYMGTYSYCPQFFGVDDFLTGYQNLELVLTLRGLQPQDVQRETESWIEEVGLTMYSNRRVSTYSGGCMRRLAAAAALCQRSDVALLDEPTAGVDTAARRRVHAALLRAKQTHAIIIASHSMDEMEALCDRMCIMAAGEMGALGSAGELRAKYAKGYAVSFKLFPEFSAEPKTITKDDENTSSESSSKGKGKKKPVPSKKNKKVVRSVDAKKETEIKEEEMEKGGTSAETESSTAAAALKEQFVREMHEKFDCELKDVHQTTMHFHIRNQMRYSELFKIIEELKGAYPHLIQDYTVTETTLEEVFLYFAKLSQESQAIGV